MHITFAQLIGIIKHKFFAWGNPIDAVLKSGYGDGNSCTGDAWGYDKTNGYGKDVYEEQPALFFDFGEK